MVAANPPGRDDGAASIPSLRKPEVRRLSSSVSTARLSVASNSVSFREEGVKKKRTQTKGSGGADVSEARQVGSRVSELVLHFFYELPANIYRQEEGSRSEFASKLQHLFVQFSCQLILWET